MIAEQIAVLKTKSCTITLSGWIEVLFFPINSTHWPLSNPGVSQAHGLVFGHQALFYGGCNATSSGSNIGGQYSRFQRLSMSEQETGVLIF